VRVGCLLHPPLRLECLPAVDHEPQPEEQHRQHERRENGGSPCVTFTSIVHVSSPKNFHGESSRDVPERERGRENRDQQATQMRHRQKNFAAVAGV